MPLPLWLSALVFLVHYCFLKPFLKPLESGPISMTWVTFSSTTPCEMSTCCLKWLTNRIRLLITPHEYYVMVWSDWYDKGIWILINRNCQWIPLLLHFFGLHWCLYRCYRWCRRSLGLLHQLEGLRQRYCFRRPRNLRSWYKITRVEPPSKSKNTDVDADTLNYLSGQPSVFSSSAPLKKKITSSTSFTNGFVFSPCTLLRQV